MVSKTLVLIGPSGRGNSTAGNLLLGQKGRFPAPEACGLSSVTTKIDRDFTRDGSWQIVYTPGLGDKPSKEVGETGDHYKERCKGNNLKYLIEITKQLAKSPVPSVLAFVMRGRYEYNLEDELEALRLCTSGYEPVLLVPVYASSLEWTKTTQNDEKNKILGDYFKWLFKYGQEVSKFTGAQFSMVLGISRNPDLDDEHPAHPQHVLKQLSAEGLCLRSQSVLQQQLQQLREKLSKGEEKDWQKELERIKQLVEG